MLRPRITPCLLVKNGGLVKTVKFDKPKYVGDPLNAVRIFNEKEVDELIVLDIDASALKREPDYELIRNLAAECRMPLCYGGGIKTVEQFQRLISLGVEKVAISSAAIDDAELVAAASQKVGSQSVVVVMDVRKGGSPGDFMLCTNNGTRATSHGPAEFAKRMETLGAGEIVVNSIDCDGVRKGYDSELVSLVRNATSLPMTVIGGAGSLKDIEELFRSFGIIGAAAGSLFVFKGPYRAVLINYPNRVEKGALSRQALP
ncbi:imidazole glycerol phosphate synthase cyclase subunit [bacterium]|nr:MAG: imidazole glycerol phosphate synthase cyclase subunit [bacterium]